MTTSMWACGKANVCGSRKCLYPMWTRSYTTPTTSSSTRNNGRAKPARTHDEHVTQRELFMDVLGANATRRDAKQFLARFKSPTPPRTPVSPAVTDKEARPTSLLIRETESSGHTGVNLGGLYAPAQAIANAPRFVRELKDEAPFLSSRKELHVALVLLRAPESLDDHTLDGLATTLSQLIKLDMRIVLILDLGGEGTYLTSKEQRTVFATQAERLMRAIKSHSTEGARFVAGALEMTEEGLLQVILPSLILEPLQRSVIPILAPLAYTNSGKVMHAGAENAVVALTTHLSGQATSPYATQPEILVDRIILLDTAGGVPSRLRSDNAHVFINLEQEYEEIQEELWRYGKWADGISAPNMYDRHRENLQLLKRCLDILPSASSALIISPYEAAASAQHQTDYDSDLGTGTRRHKNTLIHNLLTNKPVVSSSLPSARLTPDQNYTSMPGVGTATLVKRGMPLNIIPEIAHYEGWQAPDQSMKLLELDRDPRIDFARLVHLIEDSFRRKLNVEHYMNRIRKHTAGLLVAGEYEGGAIFTWEQPPGTSDPSRLVPYLDKFAVLQSSQGSSGVADILFQAMVRSCFPHGVCWRSRDDNPVNKWYFERAAGSWKIPGSGWTMFWTGEGVVEDRQRFADYVSVCKGVEPSWADNKRPD